MTRWTTVMVVLCCAAGILGCNNGEDLASSYTERLVMARCANLFRCADNHGYGATRRARFGSEDGCIAELGERGFWMPGQPPPGLVDAGRVRFDTDAAERCLELWVNSCSESFERDDACSSIWVGRVDDGDGCVDDAECASGVCTGTHDACGSCAASVPLGEECDEGRPCAPSEDGPVDCVSAGDQSPSVCVVLARSGADGAVGDSCGWSAGGDIGCGVGLFCQHRTCVTRAALGAPCEPWFDACVSGTTCQSTSETCVSVRVESRLGEPCGAQVDEFIACDPVAGLVCSSSGECEREQPPAMAGEFCGAVPCASGLLCIRGLCTSLGANGASCMEDHECASSFCDVDLGVCGAWPTCQ